MKFLIACLGNIGSEYANTRHNLGFIVADALVKSLDGKFSTERYGDIATVKFRGRTLIVLKPSTYMNLSGKAVKYWLNKENIPVENLLVVYDDIALPLGAIRIKKQGSEGGHNGMEDIIYQLETNEFPRLRFGIGNEFAKGHQVDYVLSKFSSEEEKIVIPRIEKAVEAVKTFVFSGIEITMTSYNKK
jgi:PTH1 family peptidyl-tRNA hydrolase